MHVVVRSLCSIFGIPQDEDPVFYKDIVRGLVLLIGSIVAIGCLTARSMTPRLYTIGVASAVSSVAALYFMVERKKVIGGLIGFIALRGVIGFVLQGSVIGLCVAVACALVLYMLRPWG